MNGTGPLLIMTAAFLWAVDALIRTPLTKTLSASTIVFYEHLIGLLVLSPLFIKSLGILKKVTIKTWGNVLLLSLVSSVAGTILFTQALASSFATFDFITPLLLQKLQPLMVIALSAIILKEKIQKDYIFWAILALVGSYLMSFGVTPIHFSLAGKELVVLLSLGAAACWGSGTILSKLLLRTYSTRDATFLRFLVAIPLSLGVALLLHQYVPPATLTSPDYLRFIAIALSTGAVGLLIYYFGLAKTKAHVATIAELIFPLTSVIIGITSLNPYGAAQTLTVPQIIGILLLLLSITKISLSSAKKRAPIMVTGKVVKGSGDGRKLGFPTANIQLSTPLNIDYGVYACTVMVGKRHLSGVLHFGPRVVYGEEKPLFEVHVFDFRGDLYAKTMTVEIRDFVRGTRNFSSLDALVHQMTRDAKKARRLLMRI